MSKKKEETSIAHLRKELQLHVNNPQLYIDTYQKLFKNVQTPQFFNIKMIAFILVKSDEFSTIADVENFIRNHNPDEAFNFFRYWIFIQRLKGQYIDDFPESWGAPDFTTYREYNL